MVDAAHALHSVVRGPRGYVAKCMCGWQGAPRQTPLDALEGQQVHGVVVPAVLAHPRRPVTVPRQALSLVEDPPV